jgi:hypothetical protein
LLLQQQQLVKAGLLLLLLEKRERERERERERKRGGGREREGMVAGWLDGVCGKMMTFACLYARTKKNKKYTEYEIDRWNYHHAFKENGPALRTAVLGQILN